VKNRHRGIRGADSMDWLQMSCEHLNLELRPKTCEMSAVRTNEGRLFQTVGTQHENRRATMGQSSTSISGWG